MPLTPQQAFNHYVFHHVLAGLLTSKTHEPCRVSCVLYRCGTGKCSVSVALVIQGNPPRNGSTGGVVEFIRFAGSRTVCLITHLAARGRVPGNNGSPAHVRLSHNTTTFPRPPCGRAARGKGGCASSRTLISHRVSATFAEASACPGCDTTALSRQELPGSLTHGYRFAASFSTTSFGSSRPCGVVAKHGGTVNRRIAPLP